MVLHPYEYAHFNEFVGGLEGAEGRFATDYWALSNRELIQEVNRLAGPGAGVRVCAAAAAARVMLRTDLVLLSSTSALADFTVCNPRWNKHRRWIQEERVISRVERCGVSLGVLTEPWERARGR